MPVLINLYTYKVAFGSLVISLKIWFYLQRHKPIKLALVSSQGVVSATPLVFIIPTACYLKLSDERWYHGDNLISCLILIAGVSVMTVGFVMAVLNPQECSHGKEMFYCMSSNSSFNNITFPTNVTLALNASIF